MLHEPAPLFTQHLLQSWTWKFFCTSENLRCCVNSQRDSMPMVFFFKQQYSFGQSKIARANRKRTKIFTANGEGHQALFPCGQAQLQQVLGERLHCAQKQNDCRTRPGEGSCRLPCSGSWSCEKSTAIAPGLPIQDDDKVFQNVGRDQPAFLIVRACDFPEKRSFSIDSIMWLKCDDARAITEAHFEQACLRVGGRALSKKYGGYCLERVFKI